jgi:hypothetical protein
MEDEFQREAQAEVTVAEADEGILNTNSVPSNIQKEREWFRKACSVASKYAGVYNKMSTKLLDLMGGGGYYERHHILQGAEMAEFAERAKISYNYLKAWAVPLFGGDTRLGSPHNMANQFQRDNPYESRFAAILARSKATLMAAGCSDSDAQALVDAAQNALQEINEGIDLFSL